MASYYFIVAVLYSGILPVLNCVVFQFADSDDPFEEIKRVRRHPGIRLEKVPRANVAPFINETTRTETKNLPLSEDNMNKKMNKTPPPGKGKKRVCYLL